MSLNPEQGYKAALKEPEDCYRDNAAVTQAYIWKALDWPVIKGNDVNALDNLFSHFLFSWALLRPQDFKTEQVLWKGDQES